MIDRQHGSIIICCDSCDETVAGDQDERFEQVWMRAKQDGWTCRKIGAEWVHGCPDCGA